jgi:hypothetical protein
MQQPTTAASYRKPFLTTTEFAEISALARDLEALCAEGLLEAFDDNGITRYRPIELARAA